MQLVWTSILARKNSNSKVEKNRIFQIIWIFMPKLFSNGIWRQFFAWKFKFKTGKKYFSNFSNIWIFVLKLIQFWQDKLKDFLMIFERFFMLNLASFKACKKVLSTIGNEDRCDQSLWIVYLKNISTLKEAIGVKKREKKKFRIFSLFWTLSVTKKWKSRKSCILSSLISRLLE